MPRQLHFTSTIALERADAAANLGSLRHAHQIVGRLCDPPTRLTDPSYAQVGNGWVRLEPHEYEALAALPPLPKRKIESTASELDVAQMSRMYARGVPIDDIAEHAGLTVSVVRCRLKALRQRQRAAS
jgi:hypothetical protein